MSRDLNVRMLKLSIYNEIKDQLTQLAHSKKKIICEQNWQFKKNKTKNNYWSRTNYRQLARK